MAHFLNDGRELSLGIFHSRVQSLLSKTLGSNHDQRPNCPKFLRNGRLVDILEWSGNPLRSAKPRVIESEPKMETIYKNGERPLELTEWGMRLPKIVQFIEKEK